MDSFENFADAIAWDVSNLAVRNLEKFCSWLLLVNLGVMLQEMWGSFPRTFEVNINGLLDFATPRMAKSFMLYKSCQREGCWRQTFESFSHAIEDYYRKPRAQRRKSDLDRLLERPLHASHYEDFHLNFRSAEVSEHAINELASWAYHLIRVAKKLRSTLTSLPTLTETITRLVNPGPLDKAEQIEFEDFLATWRRVGESQGAIDPEFHELISELSWLNSQLQAMKSEPQKVFAFPSAEWSEGEIRWVREVYEAAILNQFPPEFPNPNGPQKRVLQELDRVIQLFSLTERSKLPVLIANRERIRMTLKERCELILFSKTHAA